MDKETKQEFENLARMVKIGFDENAKRFDDVNKRFDDVDKRFESVNNRFDNIDSQLYEIRKDMSEIKKNVVYRDEFEKLAFEFEDLMGRVKYLENKMGIESGK